MESDKPSDEILGIVSQYMVYHDHLDASTNEDLFWESFGEGGGPHLMVLYMELIHRAGNCPNINEWDALDNARTNVYRRMHNWMNPPDNTTGQQGPDRVE